MRGPCPDRPGAHPRSRVDRMLEDLPKQDAVAAALPPDPAPGVRRRNLKRLLAPRHVAMVGGLGNIPAIEMLRASGFRGEIWPVHPTRHEIAGLPAFRSVGDLPEGPDAAFLNVPARATVDIVRDLARRGGGGAVCYSAGFSELGDKGLSTQRALVQAAQDLAVLGPNANGLLNCLDHLALWPVQSHRPRQMEKGVAILSSSGGVLFNYPASQRSVPAAIMAAVGNQAQIGFPDLIDVLVDDPRIEAIGMFAESIGDPVAFSRAAARAADRGLPIVALKTGRTSGSAALAATHSGAMIAPDDMIDALFQRCGVIRVQSLPELDETLKMLTVPLRPGGRKTVALTISGGEKALILDTADGLAPEFTAFPPQIRAELEDQIPEYASVSNPFDFNPYYSGENVLAMDNRPALERCFRTVFSAGYDIAMMLVSIRTDDAGGAPPPGDIYT
ncbi:MAG: CoA-binding protein, partial [Rhodobacteraceae bacterium]